MEEILGIGALLFGLFFSIVGVVGLMRFPDVYSRIHASGKVSTLGLFGLIVGVAVLSPSTTTKLIALAGFLLITAPVASHSIANASYRSGVPMHEPIRDDIGGQIHHGLEPELDTEEHVDAPQTS